MLSSPLWEDWAWNLHPPSVPANVDISDGVEFDISTSINDRLYLYQGGAWNISGDALIIGQNERLSDMSEGNDAILTLAGPVTESELFLISPVETGSCAYCSGGCLPFKYLLHAVGPKYDEKYLSASDYALHSAYKTSLVLAAELCCESVVITPIYKKSKGYPREIAASVALRTIRKFLEHSIGDIFKNVILCVLTREDLEIYRALMSRYFPRTEEEIVVPSHSMSSLSMNEWGEIVRKDRLLHLSPGPVPFSNFTRRPIPPYIIPPSNKYKNSTGDKKIVQDWPRARKITDLVYSTDKYRKRKLLEEEFALSSDQRLNLKFTRLLEQLREENLIDCSSWEFLNFIGSDRNGNTVVCFIPSLIPSSEVADSRKILLYVMSKMENLRCSPFSLIFANSQLNDHSFSAPIVHELIDLFYCRYKENLQQLYLLHGNWALRMYLAVALPMNCNVFWKDYVSCESLQELNKDVEVATVRFPSIVYDIDRKLFPNSGLKI